MIRRPVHGNHKPYGPYEKYFKRLLDILCSLVAIVVFSWLYLILIILGLYLCEVIPFHPTASWENEKFSN